MLAVSLLTQDLHCLLVYALCFSSSPPLLTLFRHSLVLFFLFVPILPPLLLFFHFLSPSTTAANKKQQPLDAAVLHLFSPHRQLLCAQHVCGRGGGKLSQVSPTAGGGGGATEGGETTKKIGEEEEE